MAWLYLILGGMARFLVEFWRINPPLALGLSEAQWFSFALIALGIFLLATRQVKTVPERAR
jgi:prolipoprotein diacylglyceryltransferase